MINQETISGNWRQVKGEIQKAWGKVSGDDLERAKGNVNSLIGVIEKNYGAKEEDVMKKLEDIVERFEKKMSSKPEEEENEAPDIEGRNPKPTYRAKNESFDPHDV